MNGDVKKELIDGPADASLWRPRDEDILYSQQRDEDERGSHCFHVRCGLSAVRLLQLGDQNPNDVQ